MARSLSLLLLLAIGLGLFAGPHPCHARPTTMPCHMQMKPAGPSVSAPGGHDCCKTNHGVLCENVCQMTAIAQTEILVFRMAPDSRAVVETPCPGLALLAHGIDHIPLA